MIRRVVLLAFLGALAGAAAAAIAFVSHPTLRLTMDQNLPPEARGFYPPERSGDVTFAWTSSQADLSLPGFDRASEWTCSLQFRGARTVDRPQPLVQVAADGVVLGRRTGTNEYQDLAIAVRTRAKNGLRLTIASAPAFVPGPADSRELGVQVRSLICQPSARFPSPPRRLLIAAALSAAAFGAALGALGLTGRIATVAILIVAAAQAIPLSTGFAPYGDYLSKAPRVAGWIALITAAGALLPSRWRRQPLHQAARLAMALSAGTLFLELLALLHPSKAMVDAVFHAHRLEWVLDGRYYFTQPMPDGVRFPYAIALYVVAAPWSFLTNDYVALLKIVVSVARAFAGLLLYPMTARAWNDRNAAVLAVALFHVVPLPFVVIGNANMTYAFGQSMAVVTLAVLATCSFGRRAWLQTTLLSVVAALAFLSHVGIFPLLLAIMLVVAVLYRWFGPAELKLAASRLALAAMLAAVVSVAVYYGHFPESYSTLQRVRGQSPAVTTTPSGQAASATSAGAATSGVTKTEVPAKPRSERLLRAVRLGISSFGWPISLLTLAGTIALWTTGRRDRLTLVAAACGLVYLGFVGFSATAPIEPRYQRYSEEFISRVNFAMLPIAAVLAARGAVWAWRLNLAARAATIATVVAAVIAGTRVWLVWMR